MKFFVEFINDKTIQIRLLFRVFYKKVYGTSFYKSMHMENKETVVKWFDDNIYRNCAYDINNINVKTLSKESDKLIIEYKIDSSNFSLENIKNIHKFLFNPDKDNKNPYVYNGELYSIVGTT
jgi:hypothetical protein